MNHKICSLIAAVVCSLFIITNSAPAQGTAFTYQGQLQNNGSPANGIYNLSFTLYGVSTGGSPVVGTVTTNTIGVTNGLFTVTVDFGSAVWNGQTNWLQVGVETNGASPFIALLPRQLLTPTPYAIYSETASNLTGPVSLAQLPRAVVTNNEANVTLSNTIVNGNLILSNSATIYDNYAGSQLLPLFFVDSRDNVFLGFAGNQTTAGLGGYENEAVGIAALLDNTTGSGNVANGTSALQDNTTGSLNVANGFWALLVGTNGSQNVAEGAFALQDTTNESETVAIGYEALQNDNAVGQGSISGFGENTAVGYETLQSDVLGYDNTAIGFEALSDNINGQGNTAVGAYALKNDSGVGFNTANGDAALAANTTGAGNTAIGGGALFLNTNGWFNTAIGYDALVNNASGSNNIAIGQEAGINITTGLNNIDIGNAGTNNDNNTIRIGAQGTQSTTVIAGIYGGTLPGGVATAPVIIDSNGHLVAATGTSFSPTIGDGTHNFTMSNQAGYYTKIGNLVYFEFWLQWTGKGSAVAGDNVEISLPLQVISARVAIPLGFVSGVSFGNQLTIGANQGSSSLLLYSLSNTGGTPSNVTVGNCANSGEIQISGTYRWQ